jgi:hypothetical protein
MSLEIFVVDCGLRIDLGRGRGFVASDAMRASSVWEDH